MKENIFKGINVGFTLLISSILTLRFTNDIETTLKVFQYFIPILIGYILIGTSLQYLHHLPHRKNSNRKNSSGIKGIESLYWFFIIFILVIFLASFIPLYIRSTVLVNIVVIIILWIIDYMSLSKVAKELNCVTSFKDRALVIDLKSKPKTKEEFFEILEKHFSTSNILIEYIEKDLPAIVKINGVLNRAEIGYYYDFTGALAYSLKVTEL